MNTQNNEEEPMEQQQQQQQQTGDEENGLQDKLEVDPELTEEQALDKKTSAAAAATDEEEATTPVKMTENDMGKLEDTNNNDDSGSGSSRSSTLCILGIGCGVCILIVGIVALILYLTGFFTFNDPCVGVISFVVSGVDLGSSNAESNSNPILGFLGSVLPTQVTVQLSLELQVNNTNSFKIEYSQMDNVDTIHIPEYILNGNSAADLNNGPISSENDFFVGNWNIPDGTLEKRQSNDIPVNVSASIDLSQPETLGLAPIFIPGMGGGEMAFLINGGIDGSTWVPFMGGEVRFLCLVQLDNILELGQDARIRCLTSVQVGNLISLEGEINGRRSLQSIFDETDDPACYV